MTSASDITLYSDGSEEVVSQPELSEAARAQYIADGSLDERVEYARALDESNTSPEYNPTTMRLEHQPGMLPSSGDVSSILLLVDFPSEPHTADHEADSISDNLADPYHEFFLNASYGVLDLSLDVAPYWYTAKYDKAYYESLGSVEGREQLLSEVIQAFDDEIDFSKYDSQRPIYMILYQVCKLSLHR